MKEREKFESESEYSLCASPIGKADREVPPQQLESEGRYDGHGCGDPKVGTRTIVVRSHNYTSVPSFLAFGAHRVALAHLTNEVLEHVVYVPVPLC